mgnify:CR=1 FL=1
MRNILLLSLFVIFATSCVKEEIVILEREDIEIECNGVPYCTGYYDVEIWFNNDDVPDNVIIAHNGHRADLGKVMSFEATDIPGWKFVGWYKFPNSYCEYQPLVDEGNPRIAYTYMHRKYMGNCNIGPQNIRLYAHYIQTLD